MKFISQSFVTKRSLVLRLLEESLPCQVEPDYRLPPGLFYYFEKEASQDHYKVN